MSAWTTPAGRTGRTVAAEYVVRLAEGQAVNPNEAGDHDAHVPAAKESGWHQLFDSPEFVKWQYGSTPYRVIADLDGRGHWRALFTSWYGNESYLIRGNAGGGEKGRMVALGAAKAFMRKNSTGCPPPGEYE